MDWTIFWTIFWTMFWNIFFGPFYGGGEETPLVLREGCDAVYHDCPYTSFGLLPLLNCFTIEQSTVKTSLYVN